MATPNILITNKQKRILIMAIVMLSAIFLAITIFVFYFQVPLLDIKLSEEVQSIQPLY